jgi:hypothetical protein
MWLSSKLESLLNLNAETSRATREELAVVKAERDVLRTQLAIAQNNFDWLRVRVNTLEFERVGLMERAYSIKLPAPEIIRTERDLAAGSFNLGNLFESLPLDDKSEAM